MNRVPRYGVPGAASNPYISTQALAAVRHDDSISAVTLATA